VEIKSRQKNRDKKSRQINHGKKSRQKNRGEIIAPKIRGCEESVGCKNLLTNFVSRQNKVLFPAEPFLAEIGLH
jgi:hypothetical protein